MAEEVEITLETVLETAPEELTDEQTTFLNENVEDLTDEQKETFKDSIKQEEEEDEESEDIEPQTRGTPAEKPKEEEDEADPDDEKMVGSIVDKKLKDAGVGDTRDQLQLDAFIRDNLEYSKYRANALKYMKAHPTLVAGDAIRIVSSKDQQKIGAQKERDAAAKAKATESAGSSVRKPEGGGFDWGNATPEEMEAKKNEILDRR